MDYEVLREFYDTVVSDGGRFEDLAVLAPAASQLGLPPGLLERVGPERLTFEQFCAAAEAAAAGPTSGPTSAPVTAGGTPSHSAAAGATAAAAGAPVDVYRDDIIRRVVDVVVNFRMASTDVSLTDILGEFEACEKLKPFVAVAFGVLQGIAPGNLNSRNPQWPVLLDRISQRAPAEAPEDYGEMPAVPDGSKAARLSLKLCIRPSFSDSRRDPILAAVKDDESIIVTAVKNVVGRRAVVMPATTLTKYYPIRLVRAKDSRGPFSFDVLWGVMDVFLQRTDGTPFPKVWIPGPVEPTICIVEEAPADPDAPDSDGSDLKAWLTGIFERDGRSTAKVEGICETLLAESVYTTEQLRELPKDMLMSLTDPRASKCGGITIGDLAFIDEQRLLHSKSKSTEGSMAMTVMKGNLHKVRRYFYWHAGKKTLLPLLDAECVKLGLLEVARNYKNEGLLLLINEDFLRPLTQFGKMPRGLLFYGPPGTGKTRIIKEIVAHCGLTMVEAILTAGELNKGIVGESEQLIMDIFRRAEKVPHLPCVCAIDEIETAVPKRDENGGGNQSGADKVGAFLGCITGGSDVPNLILFGATNRREAIDEAVRRRLEVSLYVGFLDAPSRKQLIMKFLKKQIPDALDVSEALRKLCELVNTSQAVPSGAELARVFPGTLCNEVRAKAIGFLNENPSMTYESMRPFFRSVVEFWVPYLELITELTMNFSGAAIESLCAGLISEWTSYFREVKTKFKVCPYRIHVSAVSVVKDGSGQYEALLHHLRRVAITLDIKLGTMTVPDILAPTAGMGSACGVSWMGDQTMCTGLMVINLGLPGLQIQVEKYKPDSDEPYAEACDPTGIVAEGATVREHHVLNALLQFANSRRLTRVIHLKMSSMMVGGAVEENKILEELASAVKQATAPGSTTLVAIDLDSIAAPQKNVSEGSMGSVSRSIGNAKPFSFVLEKFEELRRPRNPATQVAMGDTLNTAGECWCALIVTAPYVYDEFRERTRWHKTEDELAADDEAADDVEERPCTRCHQLYTPAKNRDTFECRYHPSQLVLMHPTSKWRPFTTESEARVKQMELAAAQQNRRDGDPNANQRIAYLCCFQDVGSQGCRAKHHTDDEYPDDELPSIPPEYAPNMVQ